MSKLAKVNVVAFLIVFLIAIGLTSCTPSQAPDGFRDATSSKTPSTGIPSFLKVGKIYYVAILRWDFRKVELLEIDNSGWIKVKDLSYGEEIFWINLNNVERIREFQGER